jgi:hypothetical protein
LLAHAFLFFASASRGLTLDQVQAAGAELSKQEDVFKNNAELIERFQKAVSLLERLRWICTGSRTPLQQPPPPPQQKQKQNSPNAPTSATSVEPLELDKVIAVLTETMHGITESMVLCCKEMDKADALDKDYSASESTRDMSVMACFQVCLYSCMCMA